MQIDIFLRLLVSNIIVLSSHDKTAMMHLFEHFMLLPQLRFFLNFLILCLLFLSQSLHLLNIIFFFFDLFEFTLQGSRTSIINTADHLFLDLELHF